MDCSSSAVEDGVPSVLEEYLGRGYSRKVAFSPSGQMLATGNKDGSVVVWNMEARMPIKVLINKERQSAVTSLSWSKCCKRILTSHGNCSLSLWNLDTFRQIPVPSFKTSVLHAQLHPRHAASMLVCPMRSCAYLVDLVSGKKHPLPTTKDLKNPKKSVVPHTLAATYSPNGEYVFIGNSYGEVLVVETYTKKIVKHFTIEGLPAVMHLEVSRDGKKLLVTSNDRAVRLFGIEVRHLVDRAVVDLNFEQKFVEEKDRVMFKQACFSGDGHYVAAAGMYNAGNRIFIWDSVYGHLVRVLTGPSTKICDLTWHPNQTCLASSNFGGYTYFWTKEYRQKWCDFFPGFKEIDVNVLYAEKETEFDLYEYDKEIVPVDNSEFDDVDIMTVEDSEFAKGIDLENAVIVQLQRCASDKEMRLRNVYHEYKTQEEVEEDLENMPEDSSDEGEEEEEGASPPNSDGSSRSEKTIVGF